MPKRNIVRIHTYDPTKIKGEENTEPKITDTSGYIPIEDRIDNFLLAGENLENYRKEMYDYDSYDVSDEELEEIIESKSQEYDLADAYERMEYIKLQAKQLEKEQLKNYISEHEEFLKWKGEKDGLEKEISETQNKDIQTKTDVEKPGKKTEIREE